MTELTISNYRALRDVSIPLSHFGCLIGENNSGKSSFLQALSLFFSGSNLSSTNYFDESQPIRIEICFEDIGDADLARLVEEHRIKVSDIIKDGHLALVRSYDISGKSTLLYSTLLPIEERFAHNNLAALLKGGRAGQVLVSKVTEVFP
ncbi:MAG: AAA family ATPase, partial [Thermoanaerobaculia bacterium]